MGTDDFGRLSLEQQQKLAGLLEETKSLMTQQERLLGTALEGETKIGTERLKHLRQYFEEYSEGLATVRTEYRELNDLILASRNQTSFMSQPPSGGKGGKSKGGKAADATPASDASRSRGVSADGRAIVGAINELKDVLIGYVESDANTAGTGGKYSTKKYSDSYDAGAPTSESSTAGVGDGGGSQSPPSPEVDNDDVTSYVDNDGVTPEALASMLLQEDRKKELDALRKKVEELRQSLALAAPNQLAAGAVERRATAEYRADKSNQEQQLATLQELEARKVAFIAEAEKRARLKNNGELTADEAERIQALAEKRFNSDKDNLDKITAERLKQEKKEQKEKERKERENASDSVLGKGHTPVERLQGLKTLMTDKESGKATFASIAKGTVNLFSDAVGGAINKISDLAKKLDSTVDEIGGYKGAIDTRLQGSSSNATTNRGSYWDQLTKDMMNLGAITPFFKQESFANNIKYMVDQGIAFNIKERAFLMTIKDKIATTFEVADGTLLRLIRLQQEDSTAGRLGMESALNTFLNNMYENTEYLKGVAKSVRDSLTEMESLMSGAAAAEVEYQVQKWMGSLYSVGMSDTAVNAISSALGQIAAGQIDGLTGGSGAGNLLVMAANDAGISISDMLATGIDASDTNKLLQATVNYLAEIAKASEGNNVVQQQLASVFGVKASDLRAATNLAAKGSVKDIYGSNLVYNDMLGQLYTMAGSMASRTSIGEMMSNIWANGQYTLASSLANNPVTYLLYKTASLLDSAVGGIKIPDLFGFGTGASLKFTVADLMRVGALSGGIMGSLGSMVSGLSNSFSGQAMLDELGISKGSGLKVTPRGSGIGATDAGGGQKTTSESGYVGNSSGSDVQNATLQEADDTREKQVIKAQEEIPSNQIESINVAVLKMYELLDEVSRGNKTLSVKVAGYGLTNNGSGSGAQGGVSGLLNSGTSSSLGNSSLSSSGTSDGFSGSSVSGAVDLGGWTMM